MLFFFFFFFFECFNLFNLESMILIIQANNSYGVSSALSSFTTCFSSKPDVSNTNQPCHWEHRQFIHLVFDCFCFLFLVFDFILILFIQNIQMVSTITMERKLWNRFTSILRFHWTQRDSSIFTDFDCFWIEHHLHVRCLLELILGGFKLSMEWKVNFLYFILFYFK